MNLKCTIVGIIFLHINVHYCAAQDNAIKFNPVEGNNGEPLGNITGITQDPYGYMWFSGQQANCLYKYDGNRMITYRHDNRDVNSPGDLSLETVYADNAGMIWVGFHDGGLDKFNPATNQFIHYRNSPDDPGSLSPGMVNVILRDHKGVLWIGTANGLDRFDETTGKFIHYKHEPTNNSSLSSNVVRALYEDHQGTLWIGTGYPFDQMKPTDGGLNRMETNGTFTRFLHDPSNPHSLANNKVRAIFEDSRGIFWVGTGGDGLHTMDRNKGIFERHRFNPGRPEQLSRPPLKPGAWYDHITFIKEDGSGAIWLGTYAAGITRYDPISQKVTHYESSNGYPDNSGWMAHTSADGVLWLSATESSPNLYRVDPSLRSFKNIATGKKALSFYEDREGFLWAGIDEAGLQQYDQKKNLVYTFSNDGSGVDRIGANTVYSIYQDQQDTLWLSTAAGIVLFNKKNKDVSFFHDRTKANSNLNRTDRLETYQIIQDKDGLNWFATLAGLIRYNPKNNSIKKYRPDPNNPWAIGSDRITCVLEDKSGNIWAGAYTYSSGGINKLNKHNDQFTHYLKGYNITCLYEDALGKIWAGTEKGLYRYNKDADDFVAFFDSQSEVGTVIVNGIAEDGMKNLWISTQSVIVKLNADRTGYFIYGKKYGIPANSLIRGGIYKTTKGEILIGHKSGFYTFLPEEFAVAKQSERVIITNLFINDQQVLPGNGSVLKGPVEETTELVLPHNQNNLSFQFAVIDYRAPELNKYYVMMEGYDNTWRESTGDKSAFYLNMPAGKYMFRVKIYNSDGVKAEKTMWIIIKPPWWKTWWAYSLYAILFIVFIWGMYRYQKKRIVRKEIDKAQKKELEQAKEIEKAYQELKATQVQLIQSEKMASLGELTAGIAHEIQNPLNFVNNFSELNKELIDEMQQEIDKGHLADVKSISKDIRENEEKIYHHGKRADAIVKSMLQHSRTSSGKKEPTDLNALVDEYLRLAYHGLRAKDKSFQATVQTDFDDAIGKVSIIPQDIGRVILNLITNAFYVVNEKKQQSRDGYEPTVSVSTRKVDDKVLIEVKDNGTGIPPKVLEKIFQPFFTTKPAGQGTGLGLSLSYDIVKVHGGELRVESGVNEGALFIIQLPIH